MINVCSDCLRLNPLSQKHCHYCQGDCEAMPSSDYGQFRQKRLKIIQEEDEKFQTDLREYPDLKVFADCANMASQLDLVLARP